MINIHENLYGIILLGRGGSKHYMIVDPFDTQESLYVSGKVKGHTTFEYFDWLKFSDFSTLDK